MTSSSKTMAELPWRERLSLRLMLALLVVLPVGFLVIHLLVSSPLTRIMNGVMLIPAWILAFLESRRPFLGHRLRSWVFIGLMLMTAVVGYVGVGFLGGPMLALSSAVMGSGLLLGRRTMLTTLALGAVGVGVVGYLHVTHALPPISPSDLAVYSAEAWLRTSVASLLFLSFIAVSVIYVVEQLEESIDRLRTAERQRLDAERAAMQAQKLEANGSLAAGVAHDFNNLLAIVEANAEYLLRRLPADAPERAEIATMRDVVERGCGLTRQLMQFSRRKSGEVEIFDADERVRGLEPLLSRLVGRGVTVTLHLAGEGGRLRMDPSQLEQVLLNLAVNARDAMPRGGELVVETRRDHEFLKVTVGDTGAGMDEATRVRAIEPFFTTKPAGQGTGLGLWTVHGIATTVGGGVSIESQPGQGTRIEVRLPLVA
jgi:signal transduction histidine kinase